MASDSPVREPMPALGSLCEPFARELDVTGASISVFGLQGRQSTVCSSNPLAARAEALQFELGEGPHWQSLSSRAPVLCPDLSVVSDSPWPMFLSGARGLGIRAVFAFPMFMGAAMVGVVDLYSTAPRVADRRFIDHASQLAGQVSVAAVQRALRSAEVHTSPESEMAPGLRREVHQATGVISAQLAISATDAFAQLQARAFATDRSIEHVAHQVVAHNRLPDLPH